MKRFLVLCVLVCSFQACFRPPSPQTDGAANQVDSTTTLYAVLPDSVDFYALVQSDSGVYVEKLQLKTDEFVVLSVTTPNHAYPAVYLLYKQLIPGHPLFNFMAEEIKQRFDLFYEPQTKELRAEFDPPLRLEYHDSGHFGLTKDGMQVCLESIHVPLYRIAAEQ